MICSEFLAIGGGSATIPIANSHITHNRRREHKITIPPIHPASYSLALLLLRTTDQYCYLFFLYMLLRGIPIETSDPDTKERCGLHLILFLPRGRDDSSSSRIAHGYYCTRYRCCWHLIIFPVDAKDCLSEYFVNFLLVVVPGILLNFCFALQWVTG